MARPSSKRKPRTRTAPAESIFEGAPQAPPEVAREVDPADLGTPTEAAAADGPEEAQAGPETARDEPDGETQPAPPSAAPERVMIGQTAGLHFRVPVGVVQGILSEGALARAETLRTSNSVITLQERMRASDGRCTPMIFTASPPEDGPGALPQVFGGLESLAAAMNIGLTHISVVTIRPGDAGAVQSHMAHPKQRTSETEDDFVYRVMAYDE